MLTSLLRVTTGKNVTLNSSCRHSGAQLCWPLSLTSSWEQIISLSARLIWSMSPHCWQLLNSRAMCAHVSIPSLPFLTTDTRTKNTDFHFSWEYAILLPYAQKYVCTAVPAALSVNINCKNDSCEYFSAPLARLEITELHLSVPESWNLPSQVVCQNKSSLPPARSGWARVESTQSCASSCESRQWYSWSSCWG